MMIEIGMGCSSLDQENKRRIMDDDDHHHVVSYHDDDDDDESCLSDASSLVSSENETDDESEERDDSPASSPVEDGLGDMSDLLQQLPIKRGLSKHFQGKSQSFTSFANVVCLEDLAKPENPYNKKLKSCKSYVGLSRVLAPPTRSASSSRLFSNKSSSSRPSCSSLGLSSSNRPPTHPPHRNGATTPLFV